MPCGARNLRLISGVCTSYQNTPHIVLTFWLSRMAQEGAQESEIWNHVLLNQIEAEDSMGIAASLVDDIVESAAALEYRHFLSRISCGYVTRHLCDDLLKATSWVHIRRDNGEQNPSSLKHWRIDDDPAEIPIDTWGRCIIPVREKPQPMERIEATPIAQPTTNRRGGDKEGGSLDSSRSSVRDGSAGKKSKSADSRRGKSADGKGGKGAKKKLSPEEEARAELEEKRKELEKLRKAEEADAQKEVAALEKLQKELKGKQYTYDRDGNVIVMETVEGDKLPSAKVAPKIRIDKSAKVEGPALAAGAGAVDSTTTTTKGASSKGGANRKGGRKDKEGAFVESKSAQPPLAATMQVAAGVVLKTGVATKQGPRRENDGSHMSRAEFNALQLNRSFQLSSSYVSPLDRTLGRESQGGGVGGGTDPTAAMLMGGASTTTTKGSKTVPAASQPLPPSGEGLASPPPAAAAAAAVSPSERRRDPLQVVAPQGLTQPGRRSAALGAERGPRDRKVVPVPGKFLPAPLIPPSPTRAAAAAAAPHSPEGGGWGKKSNGTISRTADIDI
jgi:hypothetical protein